MTKKIVIFGAGGLAREVAWLIEEINRAATGEACWQIEGFLENNDEHAGQVLNGIPILSVQEAKALLPGAYAVAAMGDPNVRRKAVAQAAELGFRFATLVHPNVLLDPATVKFGEGCIVCAGNIFTVNIQVQDHVLINLDCTIGHDCQMEDFVTLSPGVHLSGNTHLREGAFLGTGAVTVEKHEIGAQAVVGAGAVVVSNIPPHATAVGVPAKVVKISSPSN